MAASFDPSIATEMNSLISDDESEVVTLLRQRRKERMAEESKKISTGDKVAGQIANIVGSWRFIIIQSVIFTIWVVLNVIGIIKAWDPYPFILLNLMLSFQSAYAGPIIMMSQNRQGEIDRKHAEVDYDTNLKAELEIEWLHQKIDLMRQNEIAALTETINALRDALKQERDTAENLSEALANESKS